MINGISIGCAPAQVNKIKLLENIQKSSWLKGLNVIEYKFFIIGRVYKIIIDIKSAITPPNLLGIDRRIAYANRKYHSG